MTHITRSKSRVLSPLEEVGNDHPCSQHKAQTIFHVLETFFTVSSSMLATSYMILVLKLKHCVERLTIYSIFQISP